MAIRVPGEFHETSIKPYRGHMYGNYINEGKRTGNNFLADYIHQYALDRVDKSAMDAIVRYYNTDEKECFIAVETKYSESLGTNEAKDESTKRQERDVAVSLGVFTKEAEERIASGRIPLTQIYRNFLLSEAYGRREGLGSYSIILAPSIHPSTSAEVASLYPELKEEYRDKLPLIRNLLQICNKFRMGLRPYWW